MRILCETEISTFCLIKSDKEFETVEDGTVAKKTNSSGGLFGPVCISDARKLFNTYMQILGTAGGYQVNGAKNAMMLNIGGSATTNYVFVVGRE